MASVNLFIDWRLPKTGRRQESVSSLQNQKNSAYYFIFMLQMLSNLKEESRLFTTRLC